MLTPPYSIESNSDDTSTKNSLSTETAQNPLSAVAKPQFVATASLESKGRSPYTINEDPLGTARPIRIVTIGAGASGINMAYQLQLHLPTASHRVYEKNDDIGGTWFENRYPGCKCDIPSHNYQFAWAPNPGWTAFYAEADEIRRYLVNCCESHGLRKYIKTRHTVVGAWWSEAQGAWRLKIRDGDGKREFEDECEILIDGSGILKSVNLPCKFARSDAKTQIAIGDGHRSRDYTASRETWFTAPIGQKTLNGRRRLSQ